MATLKIEVYSRIADVSYKVTFCDEAQAMGWLKARESTHSFEVYWAVDKAEQDSFEFPRSWDTLYAYLHPKCKHGLDASLCAGPQHYPYDEDELRGMGFWAYR